MKTEFQKSIENGVLSKQYFLDSEITQNFVDWLIPFINGKGDLVKIGLDYNNFSVAIQNYKWGKGEWRDCCFESTLERFKRWETKIKSTKDDEQLNTCIEILRWGGGGKLLSSTMTKLKKENLNTFFRKMNNLFEQENINISDLNSNSNYISSGFTKIYTALNKNFIMYDGRVGAALCYIIRFYLQKNGITKLPEELEFGYGLAMGKQIRNPNSKDNNSIQFKEITRYRTLHFISNIKANWLLKIIASKVKIPNIKMEDNVFALQSALFMLGRDFSNNKKIIDI